MAHATELSLRFAELLTDVFQPKGQTFDVIPGRVYDKVVATYNFGRSVEAFVVRKTGAVVKAASWDAPQKNLKGELAIRYVMTDDDSVKAIVAERQKSSAYLYAR